MKEVCNINWKKSFHRQMKHLKIVIDEAKKLAKDPKHKMRITIGKKYKKVFEQYSGKKFENKKEGE